MSAETSQTLGEFLRHERERRGMTIEQVASATKINVRMLHALEADHFAELPAKPFVRGFVTSYCRFIGLTPKEILTRFGATSTKRRTIAQSRCWPQRLRVREARRRTEPHRALVRHGRVHHRRRHGVRVPEALRSISIIPRTSKTSQRPFRRGWRCRRYPGSRRGGLGERDAPCDSSAAGRSARRRAESAPPPIPARLLPRRSSWGPYSKPRP